MECEGDCNDNNEALNLDDADGDGWSTCSLDCDDTDAELNLDDADGDGVDTCGPDGIPGTGDEDCDDGDASIYTGAEELCDGVDNDCDSVVPDDELDTDGDGFKGCEDDCDDDDADVHPEGVEVCEDGVDNDCDGVDGQCTLMGDISLADADAKFMGEAPNDHAGYRVSTGGDVDGDGIDDVLVGARYADANGTDSGAVYLQYGPFNGTMGLASADASFHGEDVEDYVGTDVALGGDINADGFNDILIGAPGTDEGGAEAGTGYLIHGPVYGAIDPSAAVARFNGDEGEGMGGRICCAGDMDGDGHDDVLIGATYADPGGLDSGTAYLYYGPLTGVYGAGAADAEFIGEESEDFAGYVAGAGDVDDDGYEDVIIAATYSDAGGTNSGVAYVMYGPAYGEIDLSTADAKLIGENAGDRAGASIAGAGDVDADGYDDILIGAFESDMGGSLSGAAYLLYGPIHGAIGLSSADATFVGEDATDYAGFGLAGGDVDGDGYSDLLISGHLHGDGGSGYLLYGPVFGTVDLSNSDAEFLGEASDDRVAISASAGDMNGDGFDDLLLGSFNQDEGDVNAGAAYVIYGGGL
jgi:hypothetical protein